MLHHYQLHSSLQPEIFSPTSMSTGLEQLQTPLNILGNFLSNAIVLIISITPQGKVLYICIYMKVKDWQRCVTFYFIHYWLYLTRRCSNCWLRDLLVVIMLRRPLMRSKLDLLQREEATRGLLWTAESQTHYNIALVYVKSLSDLLQGLLLVRVVANMDKQHATRS